MSAFVKLGSDSASVKGLMHVTAWYRQTSDPKFTKFGEQVSIGQTPNDAKVHCDVRESVTSFLYPLIFWRPGKTSSTKVQFLTPMYSKAPSIDVPNFVLF